jgi:hypothetical protein
VRDLEASTSDVEDQAVTDGKSVDRTEEARPCLRVSVQDPDSDPGLRASPREKFTGVGRVPEGRGAERDHRRGARSDRDLPEIAQYANGAFQGATAKATSTVQFSNELQVCVFVGDDFKTPPRIDPKNHDARRVRAEIDHRDGRRTHVNPL